MGLNRSRELITALDINDHEKPRYTTRRVRYEIEQAVKVERERCAEKAASFGSDLRNADHIRHAAAKIASLIRQDPSEDFESWTDHDRYMD